MAPLPDQESPTVLAIYAHYGAEEEKKERREHLGASEIGEECRRSLWYSFRWCGKPKFEGRMLRLFQTGHREEPRVVADLRAIGMTVHDVDPNTKKQFEYRIHGGHFGGSMDGAVLGVLEAPKTWHVLEIKTSNAKGFRALKKHGVKKQKPRHYAQMQSYMKLTGMRRALYVCVCKDTDDIYAERIEYDAKFAKETFAKALTILDAKEPLTRISENPDAFACKWCDHIEMCHDKKVPDPNCRTCAHSTPVTKGEGGWTCGENRLDAADQKKGCNDHLTIPGLIPFAEVVDAGDEWVAYRIRGTDREFVNCPAAGFSPYDAPSYSSREISVVDPNAIGDPVLEAAREILDAEVVG